MAIAPVRIPQLQQSNPIVDEQGRMTNEFARRLNDIFSQLGVAINGVIQLPEIQQALLNLDTATQAAQTAANNANTAATQVTDASALANSYVSGLTIDAADTGTNVTITISAHQRVYATTPPTTVSVAGGTLTGVPYGTEDNPQAYIYYDQASRAGGTVSYQRTFDNSQVAQLNSRHSVGAVQLPLAAGAPPFKGKAISPPGGAYVTDFIGTA